jgi:L-asparaginase II
MNAAQPILELTRGRVVESTHLGSIATVDSTGKLLYSYGDPHMVAFLRSAAKPFQAIPFVERGGAEHFNFTQSELSISCASHETAQFHLDAVRARPFAMRGAPARRCGHVKNNDPAGHKADAQFQ